MKVKFPFIAMDYSLVQIGVVTFLSIALVGSLINHFSKQAARPNPSTLPLKPLQDENCIGPVLKFLKNKRKPCLSSPSVRTVIAAEQCNVEVAFCAAHFCKAAALDVQATLEQGWSKAWLFPKLSATVLQFPHKFLEEK